MYFVSCHYAVNFLQSDIHHSPAVLLKPSDYDPLQHEIKKDSSQQL